MDGAGARDRTVAQMSNPMNGSEAVQRGVALTPKVIAEVQELHARIAELDGGAGGRGRKVRHELRMAREAEQDLLRVLGFDSYHQFSTVVAAFASASEPAPVHTDAPAPEPEAAASVESTPPAPSLADEAKQTEAELLNLLRSRTADDELVEVEIEIETEATFDEAFELRVRVAALEAELGRAGFELQEMRAELVAREEVRAHADAAGVSAVVDAAAGLVQATQELKALGELLRDERARIESLGAETRQLAEQMLDDARREAQRTRDEADAHAHALLEEARSAAIEVTRTARGTLAGLRNIAAEPDDATSR